MKKLLTIALAAALATSALAMSASAADTTTYKTTDKITVEYTDVEKGWIAIYAGATPFDEYGSGSESGESRQYAYVEGSGKVEFMFPPPRTRWCPARIRVTLRRCTTMSPIRRRR